MAITAADIHNQSFSIDRKGYDVDEVDVFLEHVADEIDALNRQIAQLEDQLENANMSSFETEVISPAPISNDLDLSGQRAAIAERDARIASLESQLAEKTADANAVSRALVEATRMADDIVSRANGQAEDTIQDARNEAQRILDRANSDRQDVLDSILKLQDERESAREQYQELLKDFISDASRKLADIGGFEVADRSSVVMANAKPAAEAQGTTAIPINRSMESKVRDYSTPATGAAVAAPAPVASAMEKDLSGFGDADDSFGFEDID